MNKRFLFAALVLLLPGSAFAQNAQVPVANAVLNGSIQTVYTPLIPNGDGTYSPRTVAAAPYASTQTPVSIGATGANSSTVATLAAQAGKTNYLTGFEVTAGGATAGALINATVTGLSGGTLTYAISIPTGVTLGTSLVVEFTQPIPASAVNTAVSVTVPAAGSGSTVETATAHGFYQ